MLVIPTQERQTQEVAVLSSLFHLLCTGFTSVHHHAQLLYLGSRDLNSGPVFVHQILCCLTQPYVLFLKIRVICSSQSWRNQGQFLVLTFVWNGETLFPCLFYLYLVEKWHTPCSDFSGSFIWLTALWCARILKVAPEVLMHFLFCFPDSCAPGAPDQGIWLQDCRDGVQWWPSWWTSSMEWFNYVSLPTGPWHPDLSFAGWAQGVRKLLFQFENQNTKTKQ